ncbi:copper-translocating P-type ATPase [Idiomarina sp. OT37-5b]|uniref:heavy metal translocating P-type ATPase n=1 Tax=Idiomarina sp. OT37-5b TaxID=2100422 RepID=UPI000CF89897|nr:heavy metal translocating P-type ATPase metal-binding domain-containing protein [Idiomarina sp. OT37-5b]AVJ55947.1 copper-translocating P-type ATPase [Idiomarina sp. OT37-5b]
MTEKNDPKPCFHCLQPIPKGVDLTVTFDGTPQPVCCAGCQAVAETIIEHGLSAYYKHRDLDKPQQTPILPDELKNLEVYDHPDVQKEFVRELEGDLQQAALTISNITCSACAWLIERELQATPGVTKAIVNLSSQRLQVTWDPRQVGISDMIKRLAAIGYQARPFQPNQQEQQFSRQRKGFIRRLGLAGLATMQVMMLAFALYFGVVSDLDDTTRQYIWSVSLIFATPVILYSAQPFYIGALRALQAKTLNMDVPVSIALLGAYTASVYAVTQGSGEVYFESISMFTFFLLSGRYLELLAKEKALRFATNRLTLMPQLAQRETSDGLESVAVKQLHVGDVIVVNPGDTLAADGQLLSDEAWLDESLLSGESVPNRKIKGQTVVAGSINQQSAIRIRVTAAAQQTVLAGIVAMQDSALAEKPKVQQVIDKVASYFVSSILVIATLTFLVWWWIEPEHALWVTLAVLVATCPCALSLAAPTAITGTIHRLNRKGILVKGSQVLESVKQLDVICFDKTGTLTEGKFSITERRDFIEPEQINQLVAGMEAYSEHPLALPLKQLSATPRPFKEQVRMVAGSGLEVVTEQGEHYRLGSPAFIAEWHPQAAAETRFNVVLASKQQLLAQFTIEDNLRDDAKQTLDTLQRQGIRTLLVSGDDNGRVAATASQLNMTEYYGEYKPQQKLDLIKSLQQSGNTVWMIGDGLNDGPVLAQAHLSMTFANASDLAKTAADVVILSDQLNSVEEVIRSARKSRVIMRQNFTWAVAYNVSILPVAALGIIAPWVAALGMSLSSLLVIANSLRLYRE